MKDPIEVSEIIDRIDDEIRREHDLVVGMQKDDSALHNALAHEAMDGEDTAPHEKVDQRLHAELWKAGGALSDLRKTRREMLANANMDAVEIFDGSEVEKELEEGRD